MTTIAWDGKTLAADSQMTSDYIETVSLNKILINKDHTIGGVGSCSDIKRFSQDISMQIGKECEALVISNKTGKCQYHCDSGSPLDMNFITAIGSGAKFAMGAMLAGADAKQAVKIASKLDPYTGGRIRSKKFK